MNFDNILFDINEGVATITLNRPDVLNSFNFEMADDCKNALTYCQKEPSIRAIILTANGRGFCAGQDLEEATREGGPKIDQIVDHTYNPIITLIRTIEKPIIGAINGVAAGAGANIALACDITFAGKSASFIQSFSNIGLIPDSGGTFFLPRLIGMQRAAAHMFLADKFSAEKAAELGMIYQVVENEDLHRTAFEFAKNLAQRPTKGLGLTKRALNKGLYNTLEAQLLVEKELQAEAAQSFDHQEGIKAFFEKRKPAYQGR